MGLNARKLAKDKFDRQKLADKFVDILEKVARGHEKISWFAVFWDWTDFIATDFNSGGMED